MVDRSCRVTRALSPALAALAALLCAALPAQAQSQARSEGQEVTAPRRTALHPLLAKEVSPEAIQQLEWAIRAELAGAGLELLSEERTRAALARPCVGAAQEVCLASLARALEAELLLFGEARGVDEGYAVTLRLYDAQRGTVAGPWTSFANRNLEEMVWATRAQIARIFAPKRVYGRLLPALPTGLSARLNGELLEGAVTLPPGTYNLRFDGEKAPAEQWVEVRYAHLTRLTLDKGGLRVDLEPLEPALGTPSAVPLPAPLEGSGAPLPISNDARSARKQSAITWPAWVALGAGVALSVYGAIELGHASDLREEIEGLRQPGGAFAASDRSRLERLRGRADRAEIGGQLMLGFGVGIGLGGGYLLLAPSLGLPTLSLGGEAK